ARGAAGAARACASVSAFVVVLGGPLLGRAFARGIDYFARAVERVASAQHGGDLLLAKFGRERVPAERAEPPPARQGARGGAAGGLAGHHLVPHRFGNARLAERFMDPAGAVAAPQQAPRLGPGKAFVIDVAQLHIPIDQGCEVRLPFPFPTTLAQFTLEVLLELRG